MHCASLIRQDFGQVTIHVYTEDMSKRGIYCFHKAITM